MPDVSRARQQHRNGPAAHAVFRSERLLLDATGCPTVPYFGHLNVCETCMARAFTERLSPFGDLIGNVISVRSEEQVIRANAGRVVTVVQDVHTGGDRSVVDFPRESMCREWLYTLAASKLSVAESSFRSEPLPATGASANKRPEAFGWQSFAVEAVATVAAKLPAAFTGEGISAVLTSAVQHSNYTTTTPGSLNDG